MWRHSRKTVVLMLLTSAMTASTAGLLQATSRALAQQGPGDDGRWHVGPYSYSDELGGFRIVGVSGTGTADDPVEIAQEFESATPTVLVIRATRPVQHLGRPDGSWATGMIHMRLVAINNSGLPWIEFEFELQEQLGEPSIYGDGLSFDQRAKQTDTLVSDSFERYSRDFEPFDRVLFYDGYIDPKRTGAFDMFITDFTPKLQFYLKQDPRAPYS